jgi:hypothetical protein
MMWRPPDGKKPFSEKSENPFSEKICKRGFRKIGNRETAQTVGAPLAGHRPKALMSIPKTARPRKDPVYGKHGPLLRTWRPTVQKLSNPMPNSPCSPMPLPSALSRRLIESYIIVVKRPNAHFHQILLERFSHPKYFSVDDLPTTRPTFCRQAIVTASTS